jgi:uncharacterized membrane protein YedE/YeeE
MSPRAKALAVQSAAGLALGFSLTCIGFGDYAELHAMFTFSDLRLLFTFAGAVVVVAIGLRALVPGRFPRRSIHRGTVIGAALFGLGWAISGACPGIALVQLGQGTLGALVTLGAMLAGIRGYDAVNARWLHWETRACGE